MEEGLTCPFMVIDQEFDLTVFVGVSSAIFGHLEINSLRHSIPGFLPVNCNIARIDNIARIAVHKSKTEMLDY